MTHLYFTSNEGLYDKVKSLSSRHISAPTEILKSENGKPYFRDNPIYFSLAHSDKKAVIAFCDKPVGVDLELICGKSHEHVLNRFSERERAEIKTEEDFLKHWTAREAFVKLLGAKLCETLKKLEFFDGDIYLDGCRQDVTIVHLLFQNSVIAVCGSEEKITLNNL